MPFTGSHPAAVLPFVRTPLCASALVIGSMVPDLPYYVPGPLDSRLTHSLAGVFGLDPLLGVLVFVVWHAVLVPPALAYAPGSLGRRLPADVGRGLGRWLRPARLPLLYASLALGAGTHVFWDGFTHAHAWATRRIPLLSDQVGPMPAYHWAQYASGVVGALILIVWLVRWWRHAPVSGTYARRPPAAVPWAALAAVAAAGCAGALWGGVRALTSGGMAGVREAAFDGGTRAVALAAVVVIVLAAAWRASAARRERPSGE